MAKKKGSKSGSGDGVANLTSRLDRLVNQVASQNAGGKTGKNKKKKNKKKKIKQLAQVFSLRSDYARAVLDPFNVRGARVPDSHMLRTGVSWVRNIVNASRQNFNFGTVEQYIYVNSAPLYAGPNALVVAGVVPTAAGTAPGSFFNLGNANTFASSPVWNSIAGGNFDAEAGVYQSYRVSGGGTRLAFTGGSEGAPIQVYAAPSFNGDPWLPYFLDIVSYSTRTWTISKGKETITLPFPLRSSSTAYPWIKLGTHPGTEIDDYPDEDGPFTAAMLRGAFAQTLSTDSTNTNKAINAWSLASGMGGFQIAFKLPPGCSWSVEQIIHTEYIAQPYGALGKGVLSDDSFDVCLSNSAEVEAVGNAVAAVTQSTHDSTGGNSTVVEDLRNLRDEIGSQTAQGVTDALQDTNFLREMVGVGVLAATGGIRLLNRRHVHQLGHRG